MLTPDDILPGPHYDLVAHYDRVKALYSKYRFTDKTLCECHTDALVGMIFSGNQKYHPTLARKIRFLLYTLYMWNGLYEPLIVPFDRKNIPDDWAVRHFYAPKLYESQQAFPHLNDRIRHADKLMVFLFSIFLGKAAPDALFNLDDTEGKTLVPLIDLIPDGKDLINAITVAFYRDRDTDFQPFPHTASTCADNLLEASGALPDRPLNPSKVLTSNSFKGTPSEAVHAYLKDTPFADFLMTPIPFTINDEIRFSHCHILGSTGQGKSTLIKQQFIEDILKDDPPALVIIDPKGTVIQDLSRLDFFDPDTGSLRDRLVILDPQANPPALNMFDPASKRFSLYTPEVRQQIENNTISLFSYIFSSAENPLTPKMTTAFNYCARLLFSMPGSTIHTLLDLMSENVGKEGMDASRFKPYILRQPFTNQRFFRDFFFHPTEYAETKRQTANRIFGMLQYPEFDAMFSTPERKVDMFECLQERKIVLISSPTATLGEAGSTLFSRLCVAMTLSAAFERLAHPKHTWSPAFLVIDEAQTVVDEQKTQQLLQQAREFRLGVTLAHQQIKGQLSEALFSTLSANTRIKYAGTRSYQDAAMMARDMGQCDPSFILNQKIEEAQRRTHFACYVDGLTPQPLSVEIELGAINKQPRMSDEAYKKLIERNRALVSTDYEPPLYAPSPAPQTHERPPEGGRPATQSSIPQTHDAPTEAETSRANEPKPVVLQPEDTQDDGFTW